MTDIESLQAARVADHIVIAALMAAHPDYDRMQLLLTTVLELQLAPNGALGALLSEDQRHAVREIVEWLQTTRQLFLQMPSPYSPKPGPTSA